jgi:uncharacterized membrane protein (GlpM family)
MKLSKICETFLLIAIVAIITNGMLSDFDIVNKFTYKQIYQFAYLSFVMSFWLFFDKFIIQPMKDQENK